MLTQDKLVDLYRNLREEKVLSIYIDGRASEFSERDLWKKRLERGLAEARKDLEQRANGEVQPFARTLARVQEKLGEHDAFLPNRGWVSFATPDKLWYAEPVRVPMPDLVRWESGIRVAPYVRALKQGRPVITVLVDSRRGRVFQYQNGEIAEPVNVVVDDISGDLSDVNVSKRATSRSGVRGKTATDAAQKVLEVEAGRLRKHLAGIVQELAGTAGFCVMGGNPEAAHALRDQLPSNLQERTLVETGLHLEMSASEVQSISEDAASRLTQSRQESLLEEVINLTHSGGKGALGAEEVERALREGRVETFLLSRGFIRGNPDYADHLVGAAFEQHAEVEELSFDGAERLDTEGEGVAARLRFVNPPA